MIDTIDLVQRYAEFFPADAPMFSMDAAASLRRLVARIQQDPEITDPRIMAYMLATVRRECGVGFRPITEYAYPGDPKFSRYERRADLGNSQAGDGFRFRGRGFVQITGRLNYTWASALVGIDLTLKPEAALDFEISYQVMSYGMRHGKFTGRRIGAYIAAQKCDYLNARRVINGTDHAAEIAANAEQFEKLIAATTA